MCARVPDSIIDRRYCPKCGKAVVELWFEIHVLRCRGNKNLDLSSLDLDFDDEIDVSSLNLDGEDDKDHTYPVLDVPFVELQKTEICPYCGNEVSESLYNLHTLTCDKKEDYTWKPSGLSDEEDDYRYSPIDLPNSMFCSKCGEEVPISSFNSHNATCTDGKDDYEWSNIYRIDDPNPHYPLDDALKHDFESFNSSNVLRLYDKSYDYSDHNLIRKPLEFAEHTGELLLSTAVERQLARTLGGRSPTFGQSFVDNITASIPTSGISLIYGKPSSAGDELGLAGAAGLAAFVLSGPIAAVTVVGFGFFKAILRKIFG